MKKRRAIIIGAGPAGLTAAYELLTHTDIIPVIIEQDCQVGGLSKTVNVEGNRIDIGGHRFFSKSQKVVDWWFGFLPLENSAKEKQLINYRNQSSEITYNGTSVDTEAVMLLRPRKSRIFHRNRFFEYPLQLSLKTLNNLGIIKVLRIGASYVKARLFPLRPEVNLEQFFRNRFGDELYHTFFKDYTEKVWGVSCSQLPADWGRQRIKSLDIAGVLKHAVRSFFSRDRDVMQQRTKTSLIEQFLYPMYGPGQMWETVADEVVALGGELILNTTVTKVSGDSNKITSVTTTNNSGVTSTYEGDFFLSTMPVKELIKKMTGLVVKTEVASAAESLEYRDFLIVGILCDGSGKRSDITDNWIYIQEKNIKAGRVQFFHNWSPGMVRNPDHYWIGVEYFCNETDEFWQQSDEQIAAFAVQEMSKINIIDPSTVLNTKVTRVKKAYPSYFGGYKNFTIVESFLNEIDNLFPVGRNGMHRYNNTDHSMLTAMAAVDLISSGATDKSSIWAINTDDSYNEET